MSGERKKEEKSTLKNREEKQNRLAGSLNTTDSHKCSQTFNSNIWYGSTHEEEDVRDRKESFSHTRCPSWRHTGGHRTGFLRVQNQPYFFFNNCKKEKKK
jgi:hypothetical protein